LKNGYIIPKASGSIAITGRMFGDGIYFSDQSTKSLNYASGYWGGGRSQRCFMIFNDVAMGREHIPRSSIRSIPRGYDSCFAKAGQSGVMNNEMIVYRTSQVKPTFLCEFR
jgi:poly [ADP-ribose] polymerase